MTEIKGMVVVGVGHFGARMRLYPEAFEDAAGEALHPGTINVRVDREIPLTPSLADSKISGADIDEPDQDLLFKRCRINGYAAHRIRPWRPADGLGGHGDDILEIACSRRLEGLGTGAQAIVEYEE